MNSPKFVNNVKFFSFVTLLCAYNRFLWVSKVTSLRRQRALNSYDKTPPLFKWLIYFEGDAFVWVSGSIDLVYWTYNINPILFDVCIILLVKLTSLKSLQTGSNGRFRFQETIKPQSIRAKPSRNVCFTPRNKTKSDHSSGRTGIYRIIWRALQILLTANRVGQVPSIKQYSWHSYSFVVS